MQGLHNVMQEDITLFLLFLLCIDVGWHEETTKYQTMMYVYNRHINKTYGNPGRIKTLFSHVLNDDASINLLEANG